MAAVTRQWIIFGKGSARDQALLRLLRAESHNTGLSMSSIMRESLAARYVSLGEANAPWLSISAVQADLTLAFGENTNTKGDTDHD